MLYPVPSGVPGKKWVTNLNIIVINVYEKHSIICEFIICSIVIVVVAV